MTKTLPKLVLSASRDIPFSQLQLSQKNVRRVKAGLSIEDLAEDIYRRTLLQSINVRPLLDADGKETGMFEVPAGGRGDRPFAPDRPQGRCKWRPARGREPACSCQPRRSAGVHGGPEADTGLLRCRGHRTQLSCRSGREEPAAAPSLSAGSRLSETIAEAERFLSLPPSASDDECRAASFAKAIRRTMERGARQASLDLGDGIEL